MALGHGWTFKIFNDTTVSQRQRFVPRALHAHDSQGWFVLWVTLRSNRHGLSRALRVRDPQLQIHLWVTVF
jgi:hypothetical protein